MGNSLSLNDNLSLDIVPNDVIRCIIEFIPQVYLLSVIRVNKRISGLVLSTIVNKDFLSACRNGDIITLFRYHRYYQGYYSGIQEMVFGNNFDLIKMIYEKKIHRFWNSSLSGNCQGVIEGTPYYSDNSNQDLTYRYIWIGIGLDFACKRKIYNHTTHTIAYDYVDMIKYFIDNGAKNFNQGCLPNVCDNAYFVDNICKQLQINAIKLLISKDAADYYGSAIYRAIRGGCTEIIELLMNLPMNYNKSINRLLNYAYECNNIDSVNFIIKKGGYDVNKGLKKACSKQKLNIADKYIQLGADPMKCHCEGAYHIKSV